MRQALLTAALLVASCGGRPLPSRVVVAYPSGPVSLVPDAANEELTISVLSNVYESLVDFDAKLTLVPGLAESWYTADELTWVFTLRPGVRFHDGSPLEAGRVVASLERARRDPASKRRGELAVIESIEAKDARTVVVRTRTPFAAIPHRLANVSIWYPDADAGRPPVGTGPYRVGRWARQGDTVLEAFPGYHGGSPPIATLEFRVLPEVADRLQALRRGDVQLVADVPPDAIPSLEAEPKLRVIAEKGLRVIFLGLDCAHPPFADPRARRAVALALDRRVLVAGPLGGYAELVDQVVAPGVFGFDEALPPLPHDPAGARRLLAEAGLAAGLRVDLDFMPRKYRAMDAVVAALAADLGRAGIEARPRPWETAEFVARVERHAFTLYLWGWMSTGGDAGVSYDYLLRTPGGGFGVDNGGAYSSPEVDRLLEDAAREMSPKRRKELLASVARRVRQDVAVVPLYRQTDLYAVDRRLEFRPGVDRRIRGAQLRWSRELSAGS